MEYINTKLSKSTPAILITLFFIFFILAQGAKASCTFNQDIYSDELPFGIVLNWSTLEEINNEVFIVEKSENGKDFTRIGSVKSNGNSKQLTKYSFMDVNAQQKRIFYRVMQIDFDGSSSYSKVVKVDKALQNDFSIVHLNSEIIAKTIGLKINATQSKVLEYTLKSSKGTSVFTDHQNMIKGTNSLELDCSDLKPGIYKLELSMGEEKETLVLRKIENQERPMASTTSKK